MKRILIIPAAVLLICQMVARAETSTQTFESTWTLNDPPVAIEFDPFDDMGGTRQLTGISLGFEGTLEMEVLIQNFSDLELEADEWYYDAGANVMVAFAQKEGYEDGGPFWGLGGPYVAGITGELSAGSGGTPFENPTPGEVDVRATLSDSVDSNVAAHESNFPYFISEEPLKAIMSPFFDFVVTPPDFAPDAFINASATEMTQQGILTLTYDFVTATGRPEDCNGDGVVDVNDLACVCDEPHAAIEDVLAATGLVHGDIDGDGEVAFADFLVLSDQFGQEGDYTTGDLDCDGTVKFADFLILSDNFGKTFEGTAASVPEPSGMVLWLLGCLAYRVGRRLPLLD